MPETEPGSAGAANRGRLPEARFDGKVVRGKDGWLFLDDDTNEVMRQQRGELLFTEQQLGDWRALLDERARWLQQRGVPYYLLVPPNPHSIYPDKLPFDIAPGTPRPVAQLIKHLEDDPASASLLYPLEELVERRDEPVYSKTGTHWTDLGAFVAYEALVDLIGDGTPVRRLTPADVTFHEEMAPGGLGRKVTPPEASTQIYGRPIDPAAHMKVDNRVFLNGHRIEYECPPAGATVCLVFGDSFAHAMLPFLAESFGRVVFAHLATLDRLLVTEIKPDIVVSILNERFLIRVPVDAGAKTLEQCAAEKRASGAVYPPRAHGGNRVDTPPPWKGGDVQAES